MFILYRETFECKVGLLHDQDFNDISILWSYVLLIDDVEFFDLKIVRDALWNAMSERQYRNISMFWHNNIITISAKMAMRYALFDMIFQHYMLHFYKNKYIAYQLHVRYSKDTIVEKHRLLTSDANDIIQRHVYELVHEDKQCCIL